MNNDIVNSIVEGYKEKHRQNKASMHEILKDPLFLSLPLDKQVEAVQAYASVLSQTPPPSKGKILIKSILAGAGAGLFAALPIAMTMPGGLNKSMIALSGISSGGVIGALSGASIYKGDKERYETTNKYLVHLANKTGQDVPSSVKVLDINRKYEPRTITSIVAKMMSPEKEIIHKVVPPAVKGNLHRLGVPSGI